MSKCLQSVILSTSDRVHLNDDKDALSFDPLSESDTLILVYCQYKEQGKVIPGIKFDDTHDVVYTLCMLCMNDIHLNK